MGNICRSPLAEGALRYRVERDRLNDHYFIDSAGTHAYHVGNPPDSRAQATANEHGVDLSDLRARQVRSEDFAQFEYVLAMDNDNYQILSDICPAGAESRLHLFLDFAPDLNLCEVPDPYYGGDRGFDQVFDMVEAASIGLLQEIQQRQ